jgi:hemolysin activation/secretion protein
MQGAQLLSGSIECRLAGACAASLFLACGAGPTAALADTPAPAQAASASPAAVAPPASNEGANKKKTVEIDQFVVDGVHILSQEQVEDAVYEFLGPDRTAEDVEKARQALEKLYHDKGYQTVSVTIPPQQVEDGVVYLTVIENKVGRLRVKGAHYFSIDDIKAGAPSVAEGTVPNFNNISQDIFALNQQPDRRITPALRAGTEPGTVDVDLNVDDKLPIHGSVELNNRYSAHTVPLRLTSTVSDANLWQLGHTLSLTYQVAPQDASNSKVYSASYTAPVPGISWLSLLAYGLKNESNVAAVSGVDVVGRGYTLGARAIIALPGEQDFAHSLSVGFDYKHVDQFVNLSASTISSPVSVAPLSVTYSATWQDDRSTTQFDDTVALNLRPFGSDEQSFEGQRSGAHGEYVYMRGDLSRTQDLPAGLQLYGKVQGQITQDALISSEQFSAGGMDTVRGYLEAESLGDYGLLGSMELRSPSAGRWISDKLDPIHVNELRCFVFVDGGSVVIHDALPDQQSSFKLASVGVGASGQLYDNFHTAFDLGVPLITDTSSRSGSLLVNFRLWGEF